MQSKFMLHPNNTSVFSPLTIPEFFGYPIKISIIIARGTNGINYKNIQRKQMRLLSKNN